MLYGGEVAEGDGRTQWRLNLLPFVFTIPDGMRVVGGHGYLEESCGGPCPDFGITLMDLESGSVLRVATWQAQELDREVVRCPAGSPRDVGSQFDEIVASMEDNPRY